MASGSVVLVFFISYLTTFIIQNAYYLILFLRLGLSKEKPGAKGDTGISVLICARNEYFNLKENLPPILEQDFPDFEVVVVNYASDDDSSILLTNLADQYPHLKVVEIKKNLNFFSGKKFPLSIGIKSSKNDIILVTDADCRPASRNWLSLMASGFTGSAEIVLGFGSYEKQNGFLNKMIRYDAVQKAIHYFSFALAGVPYMGVGRNMAYRKSLFFRNKGFTSHYRLNSGDDDLFINKVANKWNTRIVTDPDSFTIAESRKNFRNWKLQKKRHISVPRHYRLKHQLLLGIYTMSVVLFYLAFIFLLVIKFDTFLVLAVFSLRLVVQMVIFNKCMTKLREKDLIWFVPVFELCLLVINFAAFISNLFSKTDKWK